jgi:hypothetical protein
MTVNDAVEQVQFVVDADGKPTAALLNISAWQTLVAAIEDAEDQGVFSAYLSHSPDEIEPIDWELADLQLDIDEDH